MSDERLYDDLLDGLRIERKQNREERKRMQRALAVANQAYAHVRLERALKECPELLVTEAVAKQYFAHYGTGRGIEMMPRGVLHATMESGYLDRIGERQAWWKCTFARSGWGMLSDPLPHYDIAGYKPLTWGITCAPPLFELEPSDLVILSRVDLNDKQKWIGDYEEPGHYLVDIAVHSLRLLVYSHYAERRPLVAAQPQPTPQSEPRSRSRSPTRRNNYDSDKDQL